MVGLAGRSPTESRAEGREFLMDESRLRDYD